MMSVSLDALLYSYIDTIDWVDLKVFNPLLVAEDLE
jgi:hypothetical protein